MSDAALVLARRSLLGLAIGDAFGETMFGDHVESTQRAAGAVAVAVAAALAASAAPRDQILPEVIRCTPPGITQERLRRAADTALSADPVRVGVALGTGLDIAAYDTVPFALWVAVRHLSSFEDAIWTATAQYGDRDALGAIVGGVVVLATGEDTIPAAWRAATERVPDPLEAELPTLAE